MAARKAFTWWNRHDGLVHQVFQSKNHENDWDIACDQKASTYGHSAHYVMWAIRRTAKARQKNHQVTCLLCVMAALKTRSGSST